MAVRIQLRRDTASNWSTNNPVLRPGEVGVETDTLKFKIGPSVTAPAIGTAWNSITAYANVVPSSLSQTLSDYIAFGDIGTESGPVGLNADLNAIIPGDAIIFEGATDDAFETTLVVTDPTADRTITFPDSSGTVALTTDIPTLDTDDVAEGTTNKYFTDERAQDAMDLALTAGTNIVKTYNDVANTLTIATSESPTFSNGFNVGSQSAGLRTSDAYTNPMAVFSIDSDSDYAQLAVKNTGNGINSSTDIIAYADNGNDTAGWIDMGIASSAFNDEAFTITGRNDGYIFMEAPSTTNASVNNKELTTNTVTLTTVAAHGFTAGKKVTISGVGAPYDGTYVINGTPTTTTFTYAKTNANLTSTAVSPVGTAKQHSGDGNLVFATGANGAENQIVFAAGGLQSDNTQMTIFPDQNVHIEIATQSTSATTGALTVAGGAGVTGNLSINGVARLTDTVYVGSTAEAFETAAALTNPAAVFALTGDPYSQVSIHNPDSDSSADLIIYTDNGTDAHGWIDMGVTGSQFSQPLYGITGPNDGYLFYEAPDATTGEGNLVIATGNRGTANKIVFAAGGFGTGTTQMEITPNQNIHIEIPTASTSATTGALTVVGGVGISGDLNIQGDVAIQGTITFGGGGTTVETENLAVTDPAIFVGTNNQADLVDLGIYTEYAITESPAITATVTNKALTDNIATLTTSANHTYLAGDIVTVTDVDATFNGTFNIIDVPSTTTFTYAKTATNVASTAVTPNGSASVGARRKYGGVIRDASDGVVKIFHGATTKPTNTVNFAESGVGYSGLKVGAFDAASATIGDVSNTELQYLNGVTGSIQTQINGKISASSIDTLTNKTLTSPKINEDVAVTATATEINILDGATLSTSELNILDGVTSSALELNILDGATLSTTELNYVDGVTSSIQTQLDGKSPSAGSTSITTLGTIATGTWEGTKIDAAHGGTGNTSYAIGDILYASASDALSPLGLGTAGYLLTATTNGPTWAAAPVSLPSQTGNNGKYLTTDGTTASWGTLVVPIVTGTATITSNTATIVDTTNLSSYTSVEYMVSLKQGSKVRTSKIIVQTNGSSVDMTEFAITETGGVMSGVSISASASIGTADLQITVTDAASTNVTVKFSKVAL